MLYRLHIALVFVAPVLLLAGLYAIGHALGVRAPLAWSRLRDPHRIARPRCRHRTATDRRPAGPRAAAGGDRRRATAGTIPGASGLDIKEKTLALGLARALRDELVRGGGGARGADRATTDRFLVLEERARSPARSAPTWFLSITRTRPAIRPA
jgi:N-acetylmuramoyl-L-alanine amidase